MHSLPFPQMRNATPPVPMIQGGTSKAQHGKNDGFTCQLKESQSGSRGLHFVAYGSQT